MELHEGKVKGSVEEIAQYNLLLTGAIFEVLAEKGVLTRAEVLDRIKKMKSKTKLDSRTPN